MANEMVLGYVDQFVPVIWEASLWYIEQNFIMPRLVKTFTDASNWAPRQVTQYEETSVTENLGELEDLTPNLLERHMRAQLTPAEHGTQHLLTDRRVEGDTDNILARAAEAIGFSLGKHLEQKLLGDIATVTGGSVGASNASLTWANLYQARARLAASGIPGPYRVVMHEYQWLNLALAVNIAQTNSNVGPLRIREDIQSRYYQASVGPDMDIFISNYLPITGSGASAYATGAIFSRDAVAWDLRRGLRIEPDRDPSLRSAELNATWVYGHGLWQPERGVRLVGLAAAPGSDVTVNAQLLIAGVADDLTPTATDSVTYTFTVVNTGSVVAREIVAIITDDADFTFTSESAQVSQGVFNESTLTWNIGSLAPGDSAYIRFVEVSGGSGSSDVTLTIDDADGVIPPLAADATYTVSVTVS